MCACCKLQPACFAIYRGCPSTAGAIITYVGKPHQQVLASLTSACGASIHITTKQGAKPHHMGYLSLHMWASLTSRCYHYICGQASPACAIITYVGKPHQQVLASLTSACGASIHITTKQGQIQHQVVLHCGVCQGCNNLPQWQCNQMSTQRGPCIASFGVPPGNNHMIHVHVPNEALSTANKVLLVLLLKKQVPGVQMDVPTLCRPCFNQGMDKPLPASTPAQCHQQQLGFQGCPSLSFW